MYNPYRQQGSQPQPPYNPYPQQGPQSPQQQYEAFPPKQGRYVPQPRIVHNVYDVTYLNDPVATPAWVWRQIEKHYLGNVIVYHSQRFSRQVMGGCGSIILLGALLVALILLLSHQRINPGLFMLPAFGLMFFVGVLIKPYGAYECSNGFLLVNELTKRVTLALAWNQVQRCWTEERSAKGKRFMAYYIAYRSADGNIRNKELHFSGLWQHCCQYAPQIP